MDAGWYLLLIVANDYLKIHQVTGLVHDLGKLLFMFGSEGQWDVVGVSPKSIFDNRKVADVILQKRTRSWLVVSFPIRLSFPKLLLGTPILTTPSTIPNAAFIHRTAVSITSSFLGVTMRYLSVTRIQCGIFF